MRSEISHETREDGIWEIKKSRLWSHGPTYRTELTKIGAPPPPPAPTSYYNSVREWLTGARTALTGAAATDPTTVPTAPEQKHRLWRRLNPFSSIREVEPPPATMYDTLSAACSNMWNYWTAGDGVTLLTKVAGAISSFGAKKVSEWNEWLTEGAEEKGSLVGVKTAPWVGSFRSLEVGSTVTPSWGGVSGTARLPGGSMKRMPTTPTTNWQATTAISAEQTGGTVQSEGEEPGWNPEESVMANRKRRLMFKS